MVEIISVRFKSGGKPYYFNPEGRPFEVDDGVIVETARGVEYATCVQGNAMIDEMELIAPLRPVIRKATDEDRETLRLNREKEAEAFEVCRKKIQEHNLDMKLVSAEYSFEGGKILFLFTADGRVDFRSLVKDLAVTLHTRIELRQIGVRDEAKLKGGLGICGRPFCCAQFLDEFQPVSIKMAKTQNLSLNPTKISGTCGRLMCCLKYEQEAYEDLVRSAPRLDSFVETPDGAGTVEGINLLRQTAQVRLESSPESPRNYHNAELSVVRSGKGKRPEGYVEPPLEELAHLRLQPEEPVQEEEVWPDDEETAADEEWETGPEEETEGESQRSPRRRRRRRSSAAKQGKESAEDPGKKTGSDGKAQAPREAAGKGQTKQTPKGEAPAKGHPPKGEAQKGQPQKAEGGGRPPKQKGEQPKGQSQKGEGQSKGPSGKGEAQAKGQKAEGTAKAAQKPARPKGQNPKGEAQKGQEKPQVPKLKPLTKGEPPKKDPAPKAEGEKPEGAKERSAHRPRRHRSRGGGSRGGGETPPAE